MMASDSSEVLVGHGTADFGELDKAIVLPALAGMTLATLGIAGVGLAASVGVAELGAMVAADFSMLSSDAMLMFGLSAA